MTPSQIKELRELSLLFKQGKARPDHIKKLSALLANINSHSEELSSMNIIKGTYFNDKLANSITY